VTQLPVEAGIKDLLSMVVGQEVAVQYASAPALDAASTGAIARYVDDEGVLRALAACDLLIANALGAALALLPRARVTAAVEAGEVPEDIAENLHEVFNVGANLFNAPDRPHLRLERVLVGSDVDPDLVQALVVAAERVDLDLDVPGFGSGAFAVVHAGPDSPTRDPSLVPSKAQEPSPVIALAVEPPPAPPRRSGSPLDAFDFEAPLPLPATAPRLVSRVQDVSPRIGVALSVACGRVVTVTCTGAERVSSGHLAQTGITWCWVDCGALGRAILAVPGGLTVLLADTLMGGSGSASSTDGRHATTLEQRLVLRHLGPALQPLVLAFAGNGLTNLAVGEPETHPLPTSTGDLVALRLLTSVGDGGAQDTITLALPARALLPGNELPIAEPPAATAAALAEVPVDVCLQLASTSLSAAEVEELALGDVIRLEHPVDRPLIGLMDDRVVLHATLGQRGRRRAVLITDLLGES
jgi:flagellar motor switch/type III secretory pathway protein FliN